MPQSEFTPEVIDRFWSRVDRSGGPDACWPWTGHLGTHGYGRMTVNYKDNLTHRVAYELTFGPAPPGQFVCHHCDNPPCCNPAHLWVGTTQDNTADRQAKGRHAHAPAGRYYCGSEHWSARMPNRTLKGERNPIARLNEAAVREIRRRHADGEGLSALGREFGVTKQAIGLIVARRNWRHVE